MHTPIPWGAFIINGQTCVCPIQHPFSSDTPLAVMDNPWNWQRGLRLGKDGEAERLANARLIVRAVNCHADLLKALVGLSYRYESDYNALTRGQGHVLCDELKAAHAAIAKASRLKG